MPFDERLDRLDARMQDRERRREGRSSARMDPVRKTLARLIEESGDDDVRRLYDELLVARDGAELRAALDALNRNETAVAILRESVDAMVED